MGARDNEGITRGMERERLTAERCSWIEEINTMQGAGEEKVPTTVLANTEPFILQYKPTRQNHPLAS